MLEESQAAARAEIVAIFRKSMISLAAHVAIGTVIIGLLLGAVIQFARDARTMGLAGAWDMFTHLPPWEWLNLWQVVFVTLMGSAITTVVMTTAFYFAERPRWNS